MSWVRGFAFGGVIGGVIGFIFVVTAFVSLLYGFSLSCVAP